MDTFEQSGDCAKHLNNWRGGWVFQGPDSCMVWSHLYIFVRKTLQTQMIQNSNVIMRNDQQGMHFKSCSSRCIVFSLSLFPRCVGLGIRMKTVWYYQIYNKLLIFWNKTPLGPDASNSLASCKKLKSNYSPKHWARILRNPDVWGGREKVELDRSTRWYISFCCSFTYWYHCFKLWVTSQNYTMRWSAIHNF